jgi:hypothetical protein
LNSLIFGKYYLFVMLKFKEITKEGKKIKIKIKIGLIMLEV